MIIKCIIFEISFLFIIYRLGVLVSQFLNNKNRLFNFLFGFIVFFAVNQIILTPLIIMHTTFKLAFYLSIFTNIFLVILSFIIKRVKQKNKFVLNKANIILTILVCIVVGFQIVFTTITNKWNADDAFYITLSMSNIDSNNIYMEEPSVGKSDGIMHLSAVEQIPSYELQVAIISKAFSISPTIVCHTLLPTIVILIAYISYYYFAKRFFNSKYSKIFIMLLSIIFMFTAFSTKYRTGCLLLKSWQGKAIFLNVVLTTIIATLIKMDKKTIRKEDVLLLFFANLSSIALTSTSIYLLPFVYLPFGIFKLCERKWKDILKLIISFIPVIIYVIILGILSKIINGLGDIPKDMVSIKETLLTYNSYTYLIYYIIATIIIFFVGSRKAKRYFVYMQIINLLTIWNPIFSNYIATHFTSSATFWRVLWIAPIEFAIAYAIIKCIKRISRKRIKTILVSILVCIILIFPGRFAYSFNITDNLENIPQYIAEQTNYILEQEKDKDEIVVLVPSDSEQSTMMRLISTKIKLICSRDMYLEKIKNTEEAEERRNIEQIYHGKFIYNTKEFENLIDKYNIDWIIIDKYDNHLLNYINKSSMDIKYVKDNYILFKNMK